VVGGSNPSGRANLLFRINCLIEYEDGIDDESAFM